ncbi:DUF5791 family protein [Halorubrum sp. DTA46]|uniref:DUF5791 family protein n=1 Tax=Halorubrum sp. DTA46 TaxID=3402162 RepID=UPI003AAFB9B0
MFHEVVDDRNDDGRGDETATEETDDAVTAAALLASFEAMVREAASDAGRDRITEETSLSERDVKAAVNGGMAELTVTDGAAVLALTADRDPDGVVAELRDHLLIGMATAVLDVDTIAASIDADLTGQEVQQALEGRTAMTLGQLAEIMAVIERRKR